MNKIVRFYRYPLSDTFMLMGMVIAFAAVVIGIAAFEKVNNAGDEGSRYKYASEAVVNYCTQNGSLLNIDVLAENDKINTEIVDFSVVMGGHTRLCEICYSYNEIPPYRLSEGRYPDREDIINNNHVVDIGQSHLKFTYEKNGERYIEFDNIEYKVIGVFEGENYDTLDYMIYFVYHCMADSHKKVINGLDSVFIRYSSNNYSVSEIVTSIINNLDDNILGNLEESSNHSLISVKDNHKKNFYFTIYGFAVVICVIISELWIYERKEEVAVLKAAGFTNFSIISRIYKTLLCIVSLGAIASYLLVLICYNFVLKEKMEISLYNLSLLFLFVIIATTIVFIIPMRRINKCTAAEILNVKEEY